MSCHCTDPPPSFPFPTPLSPPHIFLSSTLVSILLHSCHSACFPLTFCWPLAIWLCCSSFLCISCCPSSFHLSPSAFLHLHFPPSLSLFVSPLPPPPPAPPARLTKNLAVIPVAFFPPLVLSLHYSFGGLRMNAIQSRPRLRDMNFH